MTDENVINLSAPRDGVALVEFVGEHDTLSRDTNEALLRRLAAENDLVAVDLRSATFIDSSFLNCLVKAHKAARGQGHELRIFAPEESVAASLFDITGLADELTIVGTIDAAIA